MRVAYTYPSGALAVTPIRAFPMRAATMADVWQFAGPSREVAPSVWKWRLRNLPNLWRGFSKVMSARAMGVPHFYGQLWLKVIRRNGNVENLGLASMRVVTNNGVAFIVDAFQNLVELEIMKYHGIGTGTNAENASDSALQTELTTQYSSDNTRATGTTTESAANVYRTVATNTVDSAVAITEHGIFSQAATGGGVLLDRSKFDAVNLANGDSIQSTYDLTFTAGS